jgi:class 3 adenylate cyclase
VIIRRIIEFGIDGGTPLDLAIAMRTANLAALCMVGVSLLAAAAYMFDVQQPVYAAMSCVLGLGYAGCLVFSAAGLRNVARWTLLAVGCVQYVEFNLAAGHPGAASFWIVGLLAFPVAAFTRLERRKSLLVYAILAPIVVGTEVATMKLGPLVIRPEVQSRLIPQMSGADVAYYFTLLAVSFVVGYGLHYYKNSSVTAREDLDHARLQIAELLENLLPPSIAARLSQGERIIADSHAEASVLFADLHGFSALTHRLSPTHLVEVLNRLFSRFDEAAARHGIEKIKTIGDCYMAATGVLDEEARHVPVRVDAMAELALEMLTAAEALSAEIGLSLALRIGISTGAVVSGVIGTRRFNFDVWGDTVNLASQMESTGVAGRIQVTEATYWRLRGAYRLEPRGEVELKGGGHAPTYFLRDRLSHLSDRPTAG